MESQCKVHNITTQNKDCPHTLYKDFLCVMVSVKYQPGNTAKYWYEGGKELHAKLYTSGQQFYWFEEEVTKCIIVLY